MNLFRLTYGQAQPSTRTIVQTTERFEILGSAEAIWNLWFHLTQLQQLQSAGQHPSACPRFIEIRDLNGTLQDPLQGITGLSHCSTFL
ncbi:MAG: hypothetical protein HOP32_08305 [Nitrospira sp.]|nr:hypothetical protein [Nitrospira sp.]